MWSRWYPPPDWQAFKSHWPLSEHSQWVRTPSMNWHVQQLGQGPSLVLIHGTGATTHTWRKVAPLLAAHHTVWCVDLPGHGFSSELQGRAPTPSHVTSALNELFNELGLHPKALIGHSAGALIAAHWWLTHHSPAHPCALVAINPAWQSLPGPAQWLFPMGAWLVDLNPLSGWLLSQKARHPAVVERVLAQTGSRLDSESVDLYRQMWQQAHHVRGVLRLMRAWDLRAVEHRFGEIQTPVQLHVGSRDATVPPSLAQLAVEQLPEVQLTPWPQLGHLLHEERPVDWVQSLTPWLEQLRFT